MAKTTMTVGMFDSMEHAQAIVQELKAQGFEGNAVQIVDNARDLANIRGIPSGDASFYNEYLSDNGVIVLVRATQDRIAEAARILKSSTHSVDADATSTRYRESGRTEATLRDYDESDIVLPVIEENIQVGKRQVESGRMRVYTEVIETPIEEQVTLRQETVNVERRPVDRPVSADEINAFKEGAFEVRTMAEQAVVQKDARIVEEVVVNKNVTEEVQTIRDSVRRTDVKVEEMATNRAVGDTNMAAYETYNNDFQTYYNTNLKSHGNEYSYYDPAFRYGYSLANDQAYHGQDWNAVEAQARSRWEEHNPNTWDQFKDSVRYAWDTVRGRR
ncbi:MAG: DUF2382 domain-containing protein [Herpetosiphon sp.]|nr:DUF2382 domain-containing protein [Herpetosiphon sp.]